MDSEQHFYFLPLNLLLVVCGENILFYFGSKIFLDKATEAISFPPFIIFSDYEVKKLSVHLDINEKTSLICII